ncbi:5,10-methylenetetrahydrofolate reductase [Luteibacter yeojuensis]|uniref:methylenetetrahydrofolate reductase (NADH) n=2 Tax=Luteibacter yeojuensis TaxID=345309 RepID=A0A0F3KFW7_9GAMM|nr:5,10-methylenetetrahydrofolate reductase [Luteibacter yeojuensis]
MKNAHANDLTAGYSLEVGTKSMAALTEAAPWIPRGTVIAIPYLPGEDDTARLSAARDVRRLGFEPMLHIAARHLHSRAELEAFIEHAAREAGVERFFVIAGDVAQPKGPFADSLSLIDTGLFERWGAKVVGVGGHPETHSIMSMDDRWDVLQRKCAHIAERGMTPLIITQFAFDASAVVAWLEALRGRGLQYEVRIGVPGPAGIATLARYAALCGVGASVSMLAKHGTAMGKLLGVKGPDHFVDQLGEGIRDAHEAVTLHFFPFGGVGKTVTWIDHYARRAEQAGSSLTACRTPP